MLKNICHRNRLFCVLLIPVLAAITLSGCAAPDAKGQKQLYSSCTSGANAPCSPSVPLKLIDGLDVLCERSLPAADGSTASLIACAEAYAAFWQAEADALGLEVPPPDDKRPECYRDSTDAPYGSAAAYEPLWQRGEQLRGLVLEWIG